MSNYGLTLEDWDRMLVAQDGKCAICREEESRKSGWTGKPMTLAVDHCHKTGQIRGLLCSTCNQGIGLLHDDPRLLEKAIRYLEA